MIGSTQTSSQFLLPAFQSQEKEIVGAGFSGRRGTLTRALVVASMDEYAAAYLLDRQEAAWTYEHICRQAAKNCIALKAAGDVDRVCVTPGGSSWTAREDA